MAGNQQDGSVKGWGKHLFDFLMLFLAVTLGFFADNFRDEYNERKLSKELQQDMQADLVMDTLQLQAATSSRFARMLKLDSLFDLLASEQPPQEDQLYRMASYVDEAPFFKAHESTWWQLTNAGYLSFFDKETGQALTGYYMATSNLSELQREEQQLLLTRVIPLMQQHFHMENLASWRTQGTFEATTQLNKWDMNSQWLMHNLVNEMRHQNEVLLLHYDSLHKEARQVLEMLQ